MSMLDQAETHLPLYFSGHTVWPWGAGRAGALRVRDEIPEFRCRPVVSASAPASGIEREVFQSNFHAAERSVLGSSRRQLDHASLHSTTRRVPKVWQDRRWPVDIVLRKFHPSSGAVPITGSLTRFTKVVVGQVRMTRGSVTNAHAGGALARCVCQGVP